MELFQLSFYVPEKDAETVKQALFATGAGKLGDYEHCAWQTIGQGQFKPLEGSHPHIGSINQLETLKELKVEILCTADCIEQAVATLKQAHPYEEVAYFVVKNEY